MSFWGCVLLGATLLAIMFVAGCVVCWLGCRFLRGEGRR